MVVLVFSMHLLSQLYLFLINEVLEMVAYSAIDFVDDFNNREMICHEKSILQVSNKADITCNYFHQLIP